MKAEQCILRENVEEEATPLWMDVQLHLKFFLRDGVERGGGKGVMHEDDQPPIRGKWKAKWTTR